MAPVGIIHAFTVCTSRLGILSTSQCPRAKTKWTYTLWQATGTRTLSPWTSSTPPPMYSLNSSPERSAMTSTSRNWICIKKIRLSLTNDRMDFQRVVCEFAMSVTEDHEKRRMNSHICSKGFLQSLSGQLLIWDIYVQHYITTLHS